MAGLGAVVACFLILLVWDLFRIGYDLHVGSDRLDSVTLEAVSASGLTDLANRAGTPLEDASRRAHHSLPLRLLGSLPGVRRQVEGLRDMTDVVAVLGDSVRKAAARVDPSLKRAGEPDGRLELLDVTMAEVDLLDARLQSIDLGSAEGLIPPLRHAQSDLRASIADARTKLAEGRALIGPVRVMLAGPTKLLLLVANNAEMAGGAGLALSAGLLTLDQGDIDLGEVTRAGDLRLDHSVPVPGDLLKIYRPTGVGIDLRSTTRSPNLRLMGPVATEIMARQGTPNLDGVLVVDAVALRDIMRITGEVTVDDQHIDADNVLDQVLHQNYELYDERTERVSFQGQIAKAIFASLTDGDVDAAPLASALLDSSKGRHLLLWSRRPDLQFVWEQLGLAGTIDDLGLLIAFQNYGADKMDWYLRPEADLQVALLPSGDYRATLTMTVYEPSRDEVSDASRYVLGTSPDTHAIFLTVYLPTAAYDITTAEPRGFKTQGIDPPLQVRTFLADVPAGSTFTRTLQFSIPRRIAALALMPSARMVPLQLTIDGDTTISDATPTFFTWDAVDPDRGSGDTASPWVRIPLVSGLLALLTASTGLTGATLARRRGHAHAGAERLTGNAAAVALVLLAVAAIATALTITPV